MNEKPSDTKQSEKQFQLIIVLTSRQSENCPLLNKQNEQTSDLRSRANVLRACQQRVGPNTKFRAGYWTVFSLLYMISGTILYWTVLYGTFLFMHQIFEYTKQRAVHNKLDGLIVYI